MPTRARFCGLLLLIVSSTAYAAPQPGRYLGTLKVTKRILGSQTITAVRAVATVFDTGRLSVALLTSPSPFPDGRTDTFETTIAPDGVCVIPRAPVVASPASPPPSAPGSIPISVVWLIPEYHGQIQVTGSVFSLSYDDVPDLYRDSNGNPVTINDLVGPVPNAQFQFIFRRVNP
jgi:hypothetical protein